MRNVIQTERLLLRDVTEEDAALLLELDSDPEVMKYIGFTPPPELALYRDRIHTVYLLHYQHPWQGLRLIHERSTGEFLGWVFSRPATGSRVAQELGWTNPSEQEIGYRLKKLAWGNGIATEAARPLVQLALHDDSVTAIVGCAHSQNLASLRVLEKLGLQRIGEVMLTDIPEPVVKLCLSKPLT